MKPWCKSRKNVTALITALADVLTVVLGHFHLEPHMTASLVAAFTTIGGLLIGGVAIEDHGRNSNPNSQAPGTHGVATDEKNINV